MAKKILRASVAIYFSDNKEENAIAISSVRKNSETGGNNKFSNPNEKMKKSIEIGLKLVYFSDFISIYN